MQILKIKLENCYGIKKLKTDLDFSQARAIAVYAPNRAMKTSLAQAFNLYRERPVCKRHSQHHSQKAILPTTN